MVRRPGNRLPAPYFPGFDTLGTLDHLRHSGFDHSWFVLNQSIVGKEFALSGSEQNLDLTERRYRDVLRRPITKVTPSVRRSSTTARTGSRRSRSPSSSRG